MRRVWISPKKALLEHFADLEDSRTRQPMYDLQELLLTAVCAVVCGADDWETVSLWGQANLPWLRQFLPFKNGVASHDTFGRVFGLLDAEPFETRFIAWMSGMCGALEGVQIAVDGKTARRSKALHRVSVYATGLGITLGQVKTAQKSNEITAIPELLDTLLLKGCTVTIDAMRCQKAIAAKVISQEADYVLSVKNNQPTLAWRLPWRVSSMKPKRRRGKAFLTRRRNGWMGSMGGWKPGSVWSSTMGIKRSTSRAGLPSEAW